MRASLTDEELARLAGVQLEDVVMYRKAGLVDPDRDGVLDADDILRMRFVLHYLGLGYTPEQLAEQVREHPGELFLSEVLYPGRGYVSLEDAGRSVQLTADQVRLLRTAVGFSGALLGPGDMELLHAVRKILDAGLPFEALLEAARVYGDTFRRLAQAEVRVERFYVDAILDGQPLGSNERAQRTQIFTELFSELVDPIVRYVHRRHLLLAAAEDALSELETSGRDATRGALEATILFADLASFTPLAEVHGDEVAARVLERFDSLVRELALEWRGNLVKQIGDAFMLTFVDPVDAVRFAVALDEAAGNEPDFPALRAGIHSGTVLYRVGDYVGNTVIAASRIANLAQANEILVTRPVAQAAAEADVPVEEAGERTLRGMQRPMALWRISRTGMRARRRERDPVCGMIVTQPAARLVHGGFEFAFCSEDCLKRFLEHPSRYMPGADKGSV